MPAGPLPRFKGEFYSVLAGFAEPGETLEARWFTADQLPNIPPKIRIARSLIDWFINKHQIEPKGNGEWA